MARRLTDRVLDSPSARARLKASAKPYYRVVERGVHLGYRKGSTRGVWVLRYYEGGERYRVERIGQADDHGAPDGVLVLNWWQALERARTRASELQHEAAGIERPKGPFTVAKAIEHYIAFIQAEKPKAEADVRHRVNVHVLPKLGSYEVSKLTRDQLKQWAYKLAAAPARIRTRPGATQRYKPIEDAAEYKRKRQSAARRTLNTLKAALNLAFSDGMTKSDLAWRKLSVFQKTERARTRFLTLEEVRRLRKACPADFRLLVDAALATGARYSELTNLKVEDFNRANASVHVRESKSGHSRHITLTEEGVQLFAALTSGRAQAEPIFLTAARERWSKSMQARPMALACKRAAIEPGASFHVLRHTAASHAVMNGVPLLVVARNLGHRDTRMVERHYGHLADEYVKQQIADRGPRFGLVETDDKVLPIKRKKAV